MVKRVPKNEKPFRPVEHALVSRVMGSPAEAEEPATNKEAPPATTAPAEEQGPATSGNNVVELRAKGEESAIKKEAPPAPAVPAEEPKLGTSGKNVVELRANEKAASPQRHQGTELPAPVSGPVAARRNPQERFYLNTDEKGELADLVNQLSRLLGTGVKSSNVHRALHLLCRNATEEILRRAGQQHGQLYRPSNENHLGTAAFEYQLAKIISAGLRDAPALRELPRE